MKHALLATLIVIAGCSRPAPAPVLTPPPKAEFPRLETGQDAIVYAGVAEIERVGLDGPGEPWRKNEREFRYPWLWDGDLVVVLDDKGNESDPHRWIRVRVERTRDTQASLVGHDYLVRRRQVRPKPR